MEDMKSKRKRSYPLEVKNDQSEVSNIDEDLGQSKTKKEKFNHSGMEEILLRFDHLGKQIFARLDNEKLANSREAGRAWKNFIDNENLPWNRIVVQKYSCQDGETPLLTSCCKDGTN